MASSDVKFLGDTANTLTMSALEVMSDKDQELSSCKSCGQTQYKISSRVRNYAAKILGSEEAGKWFGKRYAKRSKFLHTGAIENKRDQATVSIPIIKLSAMEGMAMPMGFAYDSVLSLRSREIFCKDVGSALID